MLVLFIHVTDPHVKSLFSVFFLVFLKTRPSQPLSNDFAPKLKTRAMVDFPGIVVKRNSFLAERAIVRHAASPWFWRRLSASARIINFCWRFSVAMGIIVRESCRLEILSAYSALTRRPNPLRLVKSGTKLLKVKSRVDIYYEQSLPIMYVGWPILGNIVPLVASRPLLVSIRS